MHTEHPLPAAGILEEMPTDKSIADLYRRAERIDERDEAIEMWGTAVAWSDLHTSGSYRMDYD